MILGALVLGAVPLAFAALASPIRTPELAVIVNEILVPVDGEAVALRTERQGAAQRLTWREPTGRANLFYRVYRTEAASESGTFCFETGATQCKLAMTELATVRGTTYTDESPAPGLTYRIGVAANWEDDPEQGDVFALSEPARAAP